MAIREEERGLRKELPNFEIIGDYPANITQMPGVMAVDSVASPKGLGEAVDEKLDQNPDVRKEAIKLGKDIVGIVSAHGKEILIGVGVATTVTGIATGVIIVYKHRRR